MPHKTAACQFCDKLSPAAQIIGAINTVVIDNGKLIGHTTDGIGFMRAVKEAGVDLIGKKMTILGAGGAATSIFVQAALDGVGEISIFSRPGNFYNRAKGIIETLAGHSISKINLFTFEDEAILRQEIQASTLLVNGTSVGMAPNIDGCLIPDTSYFHPELIVSDVIYNPKQTKLLTMAKSAGLSTFNGMYMLLYQGAEAFRIWTNHEMPVDLVKKELFS